MSEEVDDALFEDQDTQKDKYLTFHIGDEDYAIAITFVTEIIGMLNITEVPQTPNYIKGVINLRGKVIPVMDIRLRFNMQARIYDERTCVIVVNHKENTVGLVVDTVSEVLDIPEANVESSPHFSQGDGNSFISGMGKVEDEIKMIIDVNSLLFKDEEILDSISLEESVNVES
jgi:purine-binding chemotaxis protein CheW